MIHSMSGGVLADGGLYLFAKVEVEGTPKWYLSPFRVEAGERVIAPFGAGSAEGTVIKTELCDRTTAPIPVKRAQTLLAKA